MRQKLLSYILSSKSKGELELDLSQLSNEDLEKLSKLLEGLRKFTITDAKLSDPRYLSVVEALKSSTTITTIGFRFWEITSEEVKALVSIGKANPLIAELTISDSEVNEEQARCIGRIVNRNANFNRLELVNITYQDGSFCKVTTALRYNTALASVRVVNCRFVAETKEAADAISQIATMLKHNKNLVVTCVDIFRNNEGVYSAVQNVMQNLDDAPEVLALTERAERAIARGGISKARAF